MTYYIINTWHRTYVASVVESYELNGKHVASLAKSGSLIYIQALDTLTSLQVAGVYMIIVIYLCTYSSELASYVELLLAMWNAYLIKFLLFCHTARIFNQ